MRGKKALLTVAALAILFWPLLAAPPSEPLAAPFQSGRITTRVSVASDGTQGDSHSDWPSISANGRYVAFQAGATNLVDGDTNDARDIFVHDRQTGETARVSVDSDGMQADGYSWDPSISGDGRYVAFESWATNLVDGDTNDNWDIFVHDRQTGQTERVSVDSEGAQGNSGSFDPSISADGRYVAFTSGATLVLTDTNFALDIFVHDRQMGETTRVSVDSDGTQGNGNSEYASISADGRYVAFQSSAHNLVTSDTNGVPDVFVHDRQTGETTRVSMDSEGTQGDAGSGSPSISADGRYVAFRSGAYNLVPGDTNGVSDVFVRDRQTGETTRVSVDSEGTEGDLESWDPSVSADGRYVAFSSNAENLVPDDTNGVGDVFVHDVEKGETTRVSVASDGTEGDQVPALPSISADGRYVAFASMASNLVPGDTNGSADVFVNLQLRNRVYLPLILKNY